MPPQFAPILAARANLVRAAACWFSALGLSACATPQPPQAHAPALLVERSTAAVQPAAGLSADIRVAKTPALPVSGAPDARDLAQAALTQLGIKYRYGGKTPVTGFDCSGLVVYAAEQSLGLKLPHHAASLARLGTEVQRKNLRVGDLVFFNTRGKRFSHMGIYLGEQQFVHAPRTGAVVRVERMDKPYWQKRYNGARRLDGDTLANLAPLASAS